MIGYQLTEYAYLTAQNDQRVLENASCGFLVQRVLTHRLYRPEPKHTQDKVAQLRVLLSASPAGQISNSGNTLVLHIQTCHQ